MSYAAIRNTRTRQALRDRYSSAEANQEALDYLNGCYELDLPAPLTEAERQQRQLKRWMRRNHDLMERYGLVATRHSNTGTQENPVYDGAEYQCYFTGSLLGIGIKTPYEAKRFVELYEECYNADRSWVSGCQVNQRAIATITNTVNYRRLPLWVKKGLVSAPESAKVGGDRIGNIWRLIPCVKAWKWAPFPKRIAENIGKCSPKMRMLAAVAWELRDQHEYRDGNWYYFTQAEQVADFWNILDSLQHASLTEQIHWVFKSGIQWGRSRWAAFLSVSLGLPWGLIDLPKRVDQEAVESAILEHGTPHQACLALFEVAGKTTVKAFQSAMPSNWKWASALCRGNADAVQKVLTMKNIIAYEPDAIAFLLSLPMVSRLRMLQATTFKYRGQVNEISNDHVRDTGYLWKNIQNKPDLGRVRCWFSVHETLAAAFVKELPDEALPIPTGWERVDGLCSVDGSWELEFPKRVATLKYYGQLLNNCVGGYGPAIKSGRSVIFVVREYGQITHCVEVSGGYVNQFYQYGNRSGDRTLQHSVESALQQAGLL